MKVLNNIISATDSKEYCTVLFLDLSNFDTVDYSVLQQRMVDLGMSTKADKWFKKFEQQNTKCSS